MKVNKNRVNKIKRILDMTGDNSNGSPRRENGSGRDFDSMLNRMLEEREKAKEEPPEDRKSDYDTEQDDDSVIRGDELRRFFENLKK